MKEEWKDIPNYKGIYQISDLGRVRSFKFNKEKILKNGLAGKGYLVVRLSDGVKTKTHYIHKLVASEFLGDRPDGYFICHSDGNCLNNNASNLYYDLPKQNTTDIYRHGRKGGVGKLSILEVCFIRDLYNSKTYSQVKLSKMFNISKMNVSYIVRGKTFEYINDDGSINDSETAISYTS